MRLLTHGFACTCILASALLLGVGCGPTKTEKPNRKPDSNKGEVDDHDHPTVGPNGGPLVEWEHDKYFVEFFIDKDKKLATVVIYDGEVKNGVPIDAEFVTVNLSNFKEPLALKLMPTPEKTDPQGKSSRFTCPAGKLDNTNNLAGSISAKVGDKTYNEKFPAPEKKK